MKRLFIFLTVCFCALALNAQNIMVCNFDDVLPKTVSGFPISNGGVTCDVVPATGSFASGNMAAVTVPAQNSSGGLWFAINIASGTFDPRDFIGVKFDMQIVGTNNPFFSVKLEQTTDAAGNYRVQDWQNYTRYTGAGNWQEMRISFNRIRTNSADADGVPYRIANTASYTDVVDKYDRIVFVPAPWESQPSVPYTILIDNIKLCRTSWDEPVEKEENLICNFDNVLPTVTIGGSSAGFSAHYNNNAPVGSPASGKVLTVTIPNTSDASKSITLQIPSKFDPREYKGISFLAQVAGYTTGTTWPQTRFGMRLQQSSNSSNTNQLQMISYNYNSGQYKGNGEWEEVFVTFDHMTKPEFVNSITGSGNVVNILDKLAANSNFPADQFDKIMIMIHPYSSAAAQTLLIDDIKLIPNDKPEEPDPIKEVEPTGNITILCDFDESTAAVTGDLSPEIKSAEAIGLGLPASGELLQVAVPANNETGYVTLTFEEGFKPSEFLGISFDMKADNGANNFRIVSKLHSTDDGNHDYSLQTKTSEEWGNGVQYKGNGEWYTFTIPFSILTGAASDPNLLYNQLQLVPASWNNAGAFTMQIDNIRLHKSSWYIPTEKENTLICNYDDVMPAAALISEGMTATDYTKEADGAPASGKILTLTVPSGSSAGRNFGVQTDFKFDPRDYVGISFLAKATGSFTNSAHNDNGKAIRFGLRLRQTGKSDDHGLQVIGNFLEYNSGEYTGDGEWQEVHLVFDHMTLEEYSIPYREEGPFYDPNRVPPLRKSGNATNIWDKETGIAGFQPSQFDRILVAVSPNIGAPSEMTLLIDNIKLRTNWEYDPGTSIRTQNADAINIFAVNGVIRAQTGNGSPVALKVYTLLGTEVASGTNQVQLATKGVYIVKASAGTVESTSKIIVQ